MFSILATAFFATYAAAQLTTSAWLPGAADANQTFVGSVVAQNGDTTTLALAFEDGPAQSDDLYRSAPDTVTLEGTTFVAYEVTAVDPVGQGDQTVTVSLECSREGAEAVPTCTMSTLGAEAVLSELCAGLSTVDGADYCTGSAPLTFDQTLTLSGESQSYINNFQLIITAGTEKLDAPAAAAAATPTTGSASAIGSAAARAGSGSPTTTNGAAPMRTMAPALFGLGAAAAAYFL